MMVHKTGSNPNEHSDVVNEDLIDRLRECEVCGEYTRPLVNQITFLHDYRQMIVYWQNTVRLISYEDDLGHPGGQSNLPIHHDFTFHKVAMDKYALTQRQKEEGSHNLQLLSSDEDEPDDDLISREESGNQSRRYQSSMTANSYSSTASSSIKIVKTAKDKKKPY